MKIGIVLQMFLALFDIVAFALYTYFYLKTYLILRFSIESLKLRIVLWRSGLPRGLRKYFIELYEDKCLEMIDMEYSLLRMFRRIRWGKL